MKRKKNSERETNRKKRGRKRRKRRREKEEEVEKRKRKRCCKPLYSVLVTETAVHSRSNFVMSLQSTCTPIRLG